MSSDNVVVIGAGIGGLSAAAALARSGLNVTVLEAHVDPGGCASTFYHQGYRFDAGATLVGGFYPGGPMEQVASASGLPGWHGVLPADSAMRVHLPGSHTITVFGDERRWQARKDAFGNDSLNFWRWQERTADAIWDLALRLPPWPPQSLVQLGDLLRKGAQWFSDRPFHHSDPRLLLDALRPVSTYLRSASPALRKYVDAQLLISAQATSQHANALYGAAALDLPRRGIVHIEGGAGAIARQLAQALRQNGGSIIFRQEAVHIVQERGKTVAVETRGGDSFSANRVLANLTPWNIARLLGEHLPTRLKNLPAQPRDGWGAFMLYLGLDGSIVPPNLPIHHQVVIREPFGEGNTAFISFNPEWDLKRAPSGRRAVTLSTHTRLQTWWQLFEQDRAAYEALKDEYTRRLLQAAEIVLPGIRSAATLILPGTPVTFQRFTRRAWGWVGGFPQTNLLRAWGPRLSPDLWMVGDSIFPGQSIAAAALGGMRVAKMMLSEMDIKVQSPHLAQSFS